MIRAFKMGGMTGGMPGALCSILVKDPIQPLDNVPQTEQDAAGLYGSLEPGPWNNPIEIKVLGMLSHLFCHPVKSFKNITVVLINLSFKIVT